LMCRQTGYCSQFCGVWKNGDSEETFRQKKTLTTFVEKQ